METTHYKSLAGEGVAEFKDRGSRFLAYAFPVSTIDEFKKRLKELKELHPKAVHYCSAYRIGDNGMHFRASDDGEPSGSAGKPMLGQIDRMGLNNVAVIVVRYFGGTLLGVPGLINAYRTATEMAIQATEIIEKPITFSLEITYDYQLMNDIMTLIKQLDGQVIKQELQLFCLSQVQFPIVHRATVIERLDKYHTIQYKAI